MLEKTLRSTLVGGFTARPATMDDVPLVTKMLNVCALADVGRVLYDPGRVRSYWQEAAHEPAIDARLVFAPDGALAGYVGVWNVETVRVRMVIDWHIHPDYRGQGIGEWLLQFGDARARQAIPLAPEGARVVLQTEIPGTAAAKSALLDAQGYALVRHFLDMKIVFAGPPPTPAIPDGLSIRVYDPEQDDLRQIYRAADEIFADHWGVLHTQPFEEEFKRWEHHWLSNPHYDPSLWFLAVDGDQIAGISLCRPQTVEDPPVGWVSQLGVRRAWRRRGLALALLHYSFAEFYRRGQPWVGLSVDADNLTGATRLYEKAGMHAYQRFDFYEKELRPGIDLAN